MQTSLFNAMATFNNALIDKLRQVGPKSLISINSANLAFPFISFIAFLFIILKIMN